MKHFIIEPDVMEILIDWAYYDRQKLVKIYDLLKQISRNPDGGNRKPKALQHNLDGCWLRYIDAADGLVYRMADNGDVQIISCKGLLRP